MTPTAFQTLGEVRERLLGYRLDSVSRLTGLAEERLRVLEADHSSLTLFEAEQLARVYGIDSDSLVDSPIRISPGDGISVLQSAEEFRDISDVTRAAIVRAANAARDLVRLRKLLDDDCRGRVPDLRRRDLSHGAPYQQGAAIARVARNFFKLTGLPIPSLRDFMKEQLPSIVVLYARLGATGPAGITFADQFRGPTIVLNFEGKNANPLVRRFSLAHELCHVLFDWKRGEPLAILSGYLTDSGLERERRANAFAVRFLCPQKALDEVRGMGELGAAKKLLSFGLPYPAVRLYLKNEANMTLPLIPPAALGMPGTEAAWDEPERPDGIDNFPLPHAPLERRSAVAEAAARAYSLGKISRDAFAEALGVPPTEDVELVLDAFALDPPNEDSEHAAA